MIATNVRLPRVLHKSLKREAKRQGIPFNQLLIDKLENYKMNTLKEAVYLVEEVIDAAVQRGLERFYRGEPALSAKGLVTGGPDEGGPASEFQPAAEFQSPGDGGGWNR